MFTNRVDEDKGDDVMIIHAIQRGSKRKIIAFVMIGFNSVKKGKQSGIFAKPWMLSNFKIPAENKLQKLLACLLWTSSKLC